MGILCWIIRAVGVHAGNNGCVEALSSSFFLPTIVRGACPLSESFLNEMRMSMISSAFFRLAQEGRDEDALLIRNECMDIWASAIITYIHAYDPEVVILGGGILKKPRGDYPLYQQTSG